MVTIKIGKVNKENLVIACMANYFGDQQFATMWFKHNKSKEDIPKYFYLKIKNL
jgi:hypothetical protein